MPLILLIRHATNDLLEKNILAGRAPGVHLNDEGKRQAEKLADSLKRLPLNGIYSSPMSRTLETAEPLSRRLSLPIHELSDLIEIDFGDWTLRSYSELEGDPRWRSFQTSRGSTQIPSGETLSKVQRRTINALFKLQERHSGEMIALFSHGDPIRAMLAYCLDIPLDNIVRIKISPASVSVVDFTPQQLPRVICINHNGFQVPLAF